MKVYVIMDEDDDGQYVLSIWSSRKLAEAELTQRDWVDKYHRINEWDVDVPEN